MKRLLRNIIGSKPLPLLTEVDNLYRETIAHLPLKVRIHYCNSLIANCILDLKETKIKKLTARIKQLMNAAKREIESLNKK